MNRIIIGTAGHVDHGKTLLTKVLTGVDTDRLPAEKERGITIELGFAPWKITETLIADLIDVPGHEKFVRTMAAGVEAVDMVLLLVAADEGIKPQTKEHLDIISLLGITHGVAVISKCDKVGSDILAQRRVEVRKLLQNSSLAQIPIVAVSAVEKSGLTQLKSLVMEQAEKIREKPKKNITRLPVDRAFTVNGFGTVVTGTLWSGNINVGDTVEIQPTCRSAKVRRIEVNGAEVEKCGEKSRVALNLPALEKNNIPHGSWITEPGLLTEVHAVEADLKLLPHAKAMAKNSRVHLRFGAKEFLGRINYTGMPPKGGTTTAVTIRFETPAFPMVGDVMIVAGYSPVLTIGSAKVLKLNPKRKRSADPMDKQWQNTKRFLTAYHRANPLDLGIRQAVLKNRIFANSTSADFVFRIEKWCEQKLIKKQGAYISLFDFEPQTDGKIQAEMDSVMKKLNQTPFAPPDIKVLTAEMSAERGKKVLELLHNRGETVKCGDILFSAAALKEAERRISDYLEKNRTVTLAEVRDLLQTSRKYALPILSRLDSIKITKRQGDVRVLAKSK